MALHTLKSAAQCVFRLDQRDLDERYPGLFLHSLQRIEVEVDGLVDPEQLSIVLRTSGTSSVRVPFNSSYIDQPSLAQHDWAYPPGDSPEQPYQLKFDVTVSPSYAMKPTLGTGAIQIISEYRKRDDTLVFTLPEGALDAFEHMGVDGLWGLELPRAGNSYPLDGIADVRIIFHFTAFHDQALADRQADVLRDLWVDRALSLGAAGQATNAWLPFVRGPGSIDLRDLRILKFNVLSSDLPANLRDPVLADVLLAWVQRSRRGLNVWLRSRALTKGVALAIPYDTTPSPLDGQAFSALTDFSFTVPMGDGEDDMEHDARTGTFPELEALVAAVDDVEDSSQHGNITGEWTIKILPEDNPEWRELDDDGDIVEIDSGSLLMGSESTAALSEVALRHLVIRVRLKVAEGVVKVRLRDDGSGGGVTAELGPTSGVRLTDGTTTTPWSDALHDDTWTEVTLSVFGSVAELRVDGVKIVSIPDLDVLAEGGVSLLGATGASAEVSDIQIERLRADGRPLEEILREDFADGADDWSLTGASWQASTLHRLDLGDLIDASIVISYKARFDLPE